MKTKGRQILPNNLGWKSVVSPMKGPRTTEDAEEAFTFDMPDNNTSQPFIAEKTILVVIEVVPEQNYWIKGKTQLETLEDEKTTFLEKRSSP